MAAVALPIGVRSGGVILWGNDITRSSSTPWWRRCTDTAPSRRLADCRRCRPLGRGPLLEQHHSMLHPGRPIVGGDGAQRAVVVEDPRRGNPSRRSPAGVQAHHGIEVQLSLLCPCRGCAGLGGRRRSLRHRHAPPAAIRPRRLWPFSSSHRIGRYARPCMRPANKLVGRPHPVDPASAWGLVFLGACLPAGEVQWAAVRPLRSYRWRKIAGSIAPPMAR